jgi:hypothetical protein
VAKPFRCNTYKKQGGGVFSPFWNHLLQVTSERESHSADTRTIQHLCRAPASSLLSASAFPGNFISSSLVPISKHRPCAGQEATFHV